jgi:hypothetical protein
VSVVNGFNADFTNNENLEKLSSSQGVHASATFTEESHKTNNKNIYNLKYQPSTFGGSSNNHFNTLTDCNAGQYSTNAGVSCLQCPAGTYSTSVTATECTAVSAGLQFIVFSCSLKLFFILFHLKNIFRLRCELKLGCYWTKYLCGGHLLNWRWVHMYHRVPGL